MDGFALNVSQPPRSVPTNDGTPWNSVTTSIILPAIAGTVWIAEPGTRIPEKFVIPTKPFNKTVKLGSTIGLAAGRGAVAIRIFAADLSSQSGEATSSVRSAPLFLAGDDKGMPLGAIRLVAYHYQGHYIPPDPATAAGKADTHLRFGALIKAAAVPLPSVQAKETGATIQADAVAGLVLSLADAKIMSTTEIDHSGATLWHVSTTVDPTEPAPGVSATARSAARGLQPAALTSVPEKIELAVDRNLTCSESSTADKNQSSAKQNKPSCINLLLLLTLSFRCDSPHAMELPRV
eukprot:COSAG02_NODE_9642_length_2153_cov_1.722493_1_plen_293_part_00